MERYAELTGNLSSKKLRHDARVARQKAKRKAMSEELLTLKRGDAPILDPTPFITVLNVITKGKYLAAGGGHIIGARIREIKKCPVDVAN